MGLWPIGIYGGFYVKKRQYNNEATGEEDDGYTSLMLRAHAYPGEPHIDILLERKWWPLTWTEYGNYVRECEEKGEKPIIANEEYLKRADQFKKDVIGINLELEDLKNLRDSLNEVIENIENGKMREKFNDC